MHLCPDEVYAFIYAWPWLRFVVAFVKLGLRAVTRKKEKRHV